MKFITQVWLSAIAGVSAVIGIILTGDAKAFVGAMLLIFAVNLMRIIINYIAKER